MSAHPMLQPTDWTAPPEMFQKAVTQARYGLYSLIWDSAIAVTLKAPTLEYCRSLVQGDAWSCAVMTVRPAAERTGYWRFRQDYPSHMYPVCEHSPSGNQLTVRCAFVVRHNALTVGRLIEAMTANGIGTASSTARLLQAAMQNGDNKKRPPTLELEEEITSTGTRQVITLRATARDGLAKWRRAGLSEDTHLLQQQIDQVARGDATPLEVLRARFPRGDDDLLVSIAAQIAAMTDKWRGMSADDGLRALVREQSKPPRVSGLPVWIDPEKQLPVDHPLRQLRIDMEAELAQQNVLWATLDLDMKAKRRIEWLMAHRDVNTLIPDFDASESRFSALAHWLAGHPMAMNPLP